MNAPIAAAAMSPVITLPASNALGVIGMELCIKLAKRPIDACGAEKTAAAQAADKAIPAMPPAKANFSAFNFSNKFNHPFRKPSKPFVKFSWFAANYVKSQLI